MKIIYKDCEKTLANDKTLPRNSYLVKYIFNENIKYDIVQSGSRVEIFDHYYDNLGKEKLLSISWTEGTVNPKLYGIQTKQEKKKK